MELGLESCRIWKSWRRSRHALFLQTVNTSRRVWTAATSISTTPSYGQGFVSYMVTDAVLEVLLIRLQVNRSFLEVRTKQRAFGTMKLDQPISFWKDTRTG